MALPIALQLYSVRHEMKADLPTTLKLLNAYDRMSDQGVSGENISGTMKRVEDIATKAMTTGILQPNGQTMVEPTMDVEHVAKALSYMANLPLDANVLTMTVMATTMPFVGRG